MRRRAPSQTWTLSRIHRVLRPLRTKVSALATALRRERQSRPQANTTATPTPTRLRPPLRRTYQTRKRKRGGGDPGSEEDGQYLPKPPRGSKSKSKSIEKVERKWSPEIVERVAAVVDAFRVLADVVYDEQVEMEGGGGHILSLRDMCVRALASDIEPSAVAAAGEESGSDDEGEPVDATNIVDQRFEEIPEHLRRAAIIPYALSMIKQHIDTISPLPHLWNHILAICLSSSASPSATNASDALQICTNLFLASLRQPRSNSRGLALVYTKIAGPGLDQIPCEVLCRAFLVELVPTTCTLENDYTIPPSIQFATPYPLTNKRTIRSPTRTPARQGYGRAHPPTPPTHDPFSALSDDPSGVLFPIRALLSRPVAHLVAELGFCELLAFVETAAEALSRWIQSDDMVAGTRTRLREHMAGGRVDAQKSHDVRSLAPRVCTRIADWTTMALLDYSSRPLGEVGGAHQLGRTAVAVGQVLGAVHEDGLTWVDVGDPFCALACAYLVEQPSGDAAPELETTLRRVSLSSKNFNTLAIIFGRLRDAPFNIIFEPVGLCAPFADVLQSCTKSLARARCPHLEATLLQLVLNQMEEVNPDVEEMLEDAEARWDGLRSTYEKEGEEGAGWKWARSKWRWDEITNTWVEKSKCPAGLEYVARTKKRSKAKKPEDVIMVSSDTEAGRIDGEESEEDVFAAIPVAPRYSVPDRRRSSVRPQSRPRPKSRTSGAGMRARRASSDEDSDDAFSDTTTKPRARQPSPFSVDGSESESDTETESETSESDTDESDFDWEQYNGRYHPHDRSSGVGIKSKSKSPATRPKSNVSVRTNTVSRSRVQHDEVQDARPLARSNRILAAPKVAPTKRQRLVVELPLPPKRLKPPVNSAKPRILGNYNASHSPGSFLKPRGPSGTLAKTTPSQNAKQVTTSTLARLCQQFSSLSSDDDRDCIDVDEDLDTLDSTSERGDENDGSTDSAPRMEVPSSDDMDLFQVVTPAPRRVRSRGQVASRRD